MAPNTINEFIRLLQDRQRAGDDVNLEALTAALDAPRAAVYEPRWVRPKRAAAEFGIGMTKLFELLKQDRLVSKKIDGLRLISVQSLEALGRRPHSADNSLPGETLGAAKPAPRCKPRNRNNHRPKPPSIAVEQAPR